MSEPVPDARAQAIVATAARADDPRTRFLISLRRARSAARGQLPLAIDLRDFESLTAVAHGGGWSFSQNVGAWTNGPIAQLLIIPEMPPCGDTAVDFQVADALTNPRHPSQTIDVNVNGAAEERWQFTSGQPWEPHRRLIVPGDAVEHLGAFLITLRVHTPLALHALGVRHDTRALGIALRGVALGLASAGSAK